MISAHMQNAINFVQYAYEHGLVDSSPMAIPVMCVALLWPLLALMALAYVASLFVK